jgi:heat shock protein HslJ
MTLMSPAGDGRIWPPATGVVTDMAAALHCANPLMSTFRSFVFVFVASLGAACAGSSSTPTSPVSAITPEQLAATWNLVSIQPTGQREQATPAGVPYTLTFADSRLSTRVDCNTCSGAFTLSGETLTAGPALACTRAACRTMAFENAYTTVLTGQSGITLSGNTLVLSSGRGVVRFTR